MPKKYYIRQYSFEQYLHGGVGYSDIETILQRNGYTPIEFPQQHATGPLAKIRRLLFFIRSLRKLSQQAEVVFLFPIYAKLIQHFVNRLSKRKDLTLICIIGDMEGLRDNDPQLLQAEINTLRRFRYFVVHNPAMAAWLEKHIGPANCATLNFFDFLSEGIPPERSLTYDISFAGNLNKSAFVQQLHQITTTSPRLTFHIYGDSTVSFPTNDHILHHGLSSPYQLPATIKGSFGLLWDGEATERLSGPYGTYLHLNSPHKLSLYILAGLPVITSGDTAAATYIKRYQIGLLINSLDELQTAIDAITPSQYQIMVSNMLPLTKNIREGKNLLTALSQF